MFLQCLHPCAKTERPEKNIQINVTSFKVRLVVVYLSLVDLDL